MNTSNKEMSTLILRDRVTRKTVDEYTSRYTVIKNSWKGKYMRIFCVGRSKIATINPQSIFYVTNSWDYKTQLVDVLATNGSLTDFTVITGKTGKNETMNFHCNNIMERAELLTDVQRNRPLFDIRYQQQSSNNIFPARKYCFNEEYRNCYIRITNISFEQVDNNGDVIGEYLFLYIKGISSIEDNPKTLLIFYGPQMKMHLYETENPQSIKRLIEEFAKKFIGLPPFREVRKLTQKQFDSDRLGVDRAELATVAEFPVMKLSLKHRDNSIKRILATSQDCLLEIDPTSYNIVSAFFVTDMYALIRCEEDNQKFMIQFKEPAITKIYTSSMRDVLLAHLVDSARSAQNLNVCVITNLFDRGKRAAPFRIVIPEEIESTLLNSLIDPIKGSGNVNLTFSEVVEFFNANIEYSGLRFTENRDGLFAENREKMIFSALMSLLNKFPVSDNPLIVIQQFYALRRLCVTRIGFSSAAVVPSLIKSIESVCMNALKMNNISVSYSVIDFLNVLMTPHHDYYELAHEEANKNRIIGNEKFINYLLNMLHEYTLSDNSSLVVQALLNFFIYILCPPYCDTTESMLFNSIMKEIVNINGKSLFNLMQHSCNSISYGAGQLIRVIMEEGTSEQFFTMQNFSLTEGGILGQLHLAIFSQNREICDLARQLISYWTFQNSETQDLMRGIFPPALLFYLQSLEEPPKEEIEKIRTKNVKQMSNAFWESKLGWFKKKFHPINVVSKNTNYNPSMKESEVFYRPRNIRIKTTLNWPMFFYQIKQDHMRPDLIWNHTTRSELREALEAEMQTLKLGFEIKREKAIAWNFREFEVRYPSLYDELKIGQHYPRLLFETKDPVIAQPKEFFNDMYHRFLLSQDHKIKLECLHGMSILYEHYAREIGQFNDIQYILKMLEITFDPIFRDRLLTFISHLLRARYNVKPFLDSDGLNYLVEILTIAHLHIDRPQLRSSTNAIEYNEISTDLQDQEKEWYYMKEGVKQDAVSYIYLKKLYEEKEIIENTKVWAQGMSSWKELKDISQLRWGIIANKSKKLFTFSEVSCIILDIFLLLCAYFPSKDENGAVMQPLPKVKRFLSSPQVLPHIVQLLLTFDPNICSRVHSLLYIIMEDNPNLSKFFLTGVFFFTLMYTGSDVLPLCRLLYLSHNKQAFQFNHDNPIIRQSFLSTMLPPALVCFLTNHGPEKFADIFLGEYETPEAIWGKEMRRYLVEKISNHISDFTPRILGNNRAIYQYCPIIGIIYEPLKNELFCAQYYLRHLCDELKYPNWNINDPIYLLREVLETWKRELDKQPSHLSRELCLEELEITERNNNNNNNITPQIIRKAYFKLAAQFHPDKNPDGREKFERIQIAYEFLLSENASSDEPNPHNIYLLLRTQSILFKRFSEKMSQYKYAGYNLLLTLIKLEYEDVDMLNKKIVLMEPATELCYFTVQNVPLNADELQEEGGIELLSHVMQRCFDFITPNATDELNYVKIARHCIHTFRVAAEFSDCRQHIINQINISYFVSKGIAYENALELSRACIQACISFSIDETLQERIINAGAIWHLLLFIFRYDYTLDESGVELQEEYHTQLYANKAAVYALQAIYALTGIRPSEAYIKTKFNNNLFYMLQKLLTPYIVQRMKNFPEGEKEILKLLNSNHETPYLFWNNSSRKELIEMLSLNSEKFRNAGIFNNENLPPLINNNNFIYSIHKEELIIGGIFIRIYNEQPTFPIEDPVAFSGAIIKFLQYQLQNNSINGIILVVEAIKNLIIAYPKTEVTNIISENIEILLKLFSYNNNIIIIKNFELLEKISLHRNCLEAIGKVNIAITQVILSINRNGEKVESNCISFLRVALSDRGVIQQALDRGLYVILLRIFGTTSIQNCKEDVCSSLAKMFTDKLYGPKIFLRASKLIPSVILEMMKENTITACQLLDTWQETPELVWNKETKNNFIEKCILCQESIVELLENNPIGYWKIPENISIERSEDLQIGGVYLMLYLNSPGWTVRKPKEFLGELLERFIEESEKSNNQLNPENISLIVDSGVRLIQTTPTVADYIVSLGYVQKLFKVLESTEEIVSNNAIKLLHEFSISKVFIENLVNFDPISSLLTYLRTHQPQLPILMSILERLISRTSEKTNMIRLALRNELPKYLLNLLEIGVSSESCGDQSPAAVRALIIKVLKAMLAVQDPMYGPQLENILSESKVWEKYKDQSHDLFLTNTRFAGYLESSRQQQQPLSLTASSSNQTNNNNNNSDEPPPV